MTGQISSQRIISLLPSWLWRQLRALHQESGGALFLAGGTVRDLVLEKSPQDIDLTIARDARQWARGLAAQTGGAYVILGRNEDAARVVAHGVTIDFSAFRQDAETIVEDLGLRDFTINALAVCLDPLLHEADSSLGELPVLDPTGGQQDLEHGLIRMAGPESFADDPLRLLRAFRFAAILGFRIEARTLACIQRQCGLIARPAPERIAHELDLIMASGNGHKTIRSMADTGLLWELIPELAAGRAMAQPKSHHLDVFEHSLETLLQMERIVSDPGRWFPGSAAQLAAYVQRQGMRRRLCWAALMHDVGKPPTFVRRPEDDRITFYHHDQVGARILEAFALRLRWSNEDRDLIGPLISLHMRPFFLANSAREGRLTLRACIRLLRKVGDLLPGLFLLAMADSLAGQGEERVAGMEQELADLYLHLQQVHRDHVAPVRAAKPLINGRDLIEQLGLHPGPIFTTILRAVEEARMEGRITDTEEALALARSIATRTP
jgi:poly(A) polymerase